MIDYNYTLSPRNQLWFIIIQYFQKSELIIVHSNPIVTDLVDQNLYNFFFQIFCKTSNFVALLTAYSINKPTYISIFLVKRYCSWKKPLDHPEFQKISNLFSALEKQAKMAFLSIFRTLW